MPNEEQVEEKKTTPIIKSEKTTPERPTPPPSPKIIRKANTKAKGGKSKQNKKQNKNKSKKNKRS